MKKIIALFVLLMAVNVIAATLTPIQLISPAGSSNGQVITSSGSALYWATPLSAPVSSVAGRTGAITLGVTDVSGAAPLASPSFTGAVASATPIPVTAGGSGVATLTGLTLGNGASAFSAYAGTSCINQFARSLSSSGVATCASVANTDLSNSSFTIGSTSVSLGGTSVSISGLSLVAPVLGTPTSGVATNLTGTASGLTAGNVTTNANLTGPITSSGNASAVAAQTGTGSTFVMQSSPTLTTPNIGAATGTSLDGAVIGGTTAAAITGTIITANTKFLSSINGTSSAPVYSFTSESNTGFYRSGSADIRFTLSGADFLRFTGSGIINAPGNVIQWGSAGTASADAGFARNAVGTIAQRSGATPQARQLFNTYTDTNNGEWLDESWASNAVTIATKANGTGTVRQLNITSPALTGTPTAPTATAGTNTTQVATTAFVSTATSGLTPTLSGTTGSIGGGALVAGACTSGTVTITGATTAMVPVASPVTYPGDGFDWISYVSSSNTVTVKVCGLIAGTPTASNYNVRIVQ